MFLSWKTSSQKQLPLNCVNRSCDHIVEITIASTLTYVGRPNLSRIQLNCACVPVGFQACCMFPGKVGLHVPKPLWSLEIFGWSSEIIGDHRNPHMQGCKKWSSEIIGDHRRSSEIIGAGACRVPVGIQMKKEEWFKRFSGTCKKKLHWQFT